MNRNLLLAPLVKSAILLFVVTLLIYLTATSPEGSFWASVGTLCIAIFRGVQLTLGLVISLLFCLAVLTGIFLGGVAMVSRESAGKMLEQLRQSISDKLLYVRAFLIRDNKAGEGSAAGENAKGMAEELHTAMEGSLDIIREDQTVADRNIEWLLERMDRIEQGEVTESLAARLLAIQEERMKELGAGFALLDSKLATLEEKVEELSLHLQEEKSGGETNEQAGQLEALQKGMDSLREELSSLIKSGSAAGTEKEDESDSEDDSAAEQRFFAHIPNAAMQAKIEQLVTETLDSGMSYAQVIDHLVKQTSGKTSEAVAAHPSLAKEYIRYRRRNG